jgi:hypothetical protein
MNQLDANENGNQRPEQRDCAQAQVNDDLFDITNRNGAKNQRTHDD